MWRDKLFEMINQEFKARGRKYQVLTKFGICCRELGGLKVASFRACVRSFCSVTFEGIVEAPCVMLSCMALTNHTTLKQVGPLLKDRNG